MSLLDDMPQKWLDYAVARTGINLPNCFTWSTARISWAVGKNQALDSNGRVSFASQLWNSHSPELTQSQTPCVGALMIWFIWGYIDGVYCNHGHVANVESVNSDGTITWSQSNYGGTLFEIVTGNPKTIYGNGFQGYLVHNDLNKKTVIKKSNMTEEDWGVKFINDTPITIHKDTSDGQAWGTWTKGEKLHYTHKGVGNGHRWVGWTEGSQFYVCAISGSETRGHDMWVELCDPSSFEKKTEPKKEESKTESKKDYTKNIRHYGVDISEHNGDVDVSKYDFVILRACYALNTDGWFLANVVKCQKANIPFGVYCYSYAENEDEAINEANYIMKLVQDMDVKLGIWFDMEDADGFKAKQGCLKKEIITPMVKAFCDTCKENGYYTGVYTSTSWLGTYVSTEYPIWEANWGTNDGTVQGDFSDRAVMHQYSAYNGMDYNALYVDYEKLKSNPKQIIEQVEKEPTDNQNDSTVNDLYNSEGNKTLLDLILDVMKYILKWFGRE